MSLRAAYRTRVDAGEIQADPGQAAGLEALARLEAELNAAGEPSFLSLFKKPSAPGVTYGGGRPRQVQWMDLCFATEPWSGSCASLPGFMTEVHGRIHALGTAQLAGASQFGPPTKGATDRAVAELIARARAALSTSCRSPHHRSMIWAAVMPCSPRGDVVATSKRAPDTLQDASTASYSALHRLVRRGCRCRRAGAHDWRIERLKAASLFLAVTPLTASLRRF